MPLIELPGLDEVEIGNDRSGHCFLNPQQGAYRPPSVFKRPGPFAP